MTNDNEIYDTLDLFFADDDREYEADRKAGTCLQEDELRTLYCGTNVQGFDENGSPILSDEHKTYEANYRREFPMLKHTGKNARSSDQLASAIRHEYSKYGLEE